MYEIKINCPDGTKELVANTKETYWAKRYHTITWARYQTLAEAEHDLADIRAGICPGSASAWIEAR